MSFLDALITRLHADSDGGFNTIMTYQQSQNPLDSSRVSRKNLNRVSSLDRQINKA